MTQGAQKVIKDALALPEEEMEEVVEAFLEHLDQTPKTPAKLEPELHERVERRIEQIQKGEVELVEWEDAKADVLASLDELDQ